VGGDNYVVFDLTTKYLGPLRKLGEEI